MTPDPAKTTQVQFSLTPEYSDYYQFNCWLTSQTVKAFQVIGGILVFVYLLSPLVFESDRGIIGVYIGASPTLILPAIVFLWTPFSLKRLTLKAWQTTAEVREPRTYTLDSEGVRVKAVTFDGFTAWQHISSAIAFRDLVLLRTFQPAYFIIPIRDIGSAEDYTRFKQLVEAHVSDASL